MSRFRIGYDCGGGFLGGGDIFFLLKFSCGEEDCGVI